MIKSIERPGIFPKSCTTNNRSLTQGQHRIHFLEPLFLTIVAPYLQTFKETMY
jgi:hypothetical protein